MCYTHLNQNMQVQYDFDNLNMDNKLPVSVKENVYLIFKEAVNNIAKYSNGDKVQIKLENQDGNFEFNVYDNGTTGKGTKRPVMDYVTWKCERIALAQILILKLKMGFQ